MFDRNGSVGAVFVGDDKVERERAMWSVVANFLDNGGKVFVFNEEGVLVSVPSKNVSMACLGACEFSRLVDKYLSFSENCKKYLLKKRVESLEAYFASFGGSASRVAIVVPELDKLLCLENGVELLHKLILIERYSCYSGVSVLVCDGGEMSEGVASMLSFGFQNKYVFSLGKDGLVKTFTFGKISSTRNLNHGESYLVSLDEGIGRVVDFCSQNN